MRLYFLIAFLILSNSMASDIEDIKNSMMQNYLEQTANVQATKKDNEALIEQNSIYYTNIVNSARKYYKGFVAKEWGDENVKLSNKKIFTQYSDDMKSRESINFKKGEITIEVVVDKDETITPKIFNKTLKALKKQTPQQALKKDPVNVLAQKYMKKKKIIKQKPKTNKASKKPILKELVPKTVITKKDIKVKEVTLKDGKKKKIVSVTIKMVPDHLQKRAKRYQAQVLKEAKKFKIQPSYILATMQSESYFNPMAISHVPAYGLMQIVPSTAGIDAYMALRGKKRLLPPVYLYNAKKNIELGAQYINIVKYRYLRGIKNEQSLMYCTAVSYNAGIGSLIYSFTGSKRKRKEAIAKINSMTSDEVYKHLRTSKRLMLEARNYVKKIKNNSQNYMILDTQI